MNPNPHLGQAHAEAVADALPEGAHPFVIGDHICVLETLSESGTGLVILAPALTPRHMALLANALAQIIEHSVESPIEHESNMEGEADAA
jgi:hypothetical protein